jgi:hypothetical protein
MLPGHGKGRGKRHAKVDDERPHIFPPDFKEKKNFIFFRSKPPAKTQSSSGLTTRTKSKKKFEIFGTFFLFWSGASSKYTN